MKATPYWWAWLYYSSDDAVDHCRSLDVFTFYLASINVKSEDSILLKNSMIRSHCVFKELDMRALHVIREKFYSYATKDAACNFVSQKWECFM